MFSAITTITGSIIGQFWKEACTQKKLWRGQLFLCMVLSTDGSPCFIGKAAAAAAAAAGPIEPCVAQRSVTTGARF